LLKNKTANKKQKKSKFEQDSNLMVKKLNPQGSYNQILQQRVENLQRIEVIDKIKDFRILNEYEEYKKIKHIADRSAAASRMAEVLESSLEGNSRL
jgi:hypothetical protein